jgi:hypothetical protein
LPTLVVFRCKTPGRRSATGRIGRGANPPPQLGQTLNGTFPTHSAPCTHKNKFGRRPRCGRTRHDPRQGDRAAAARSSPQTGRERSRTNRGGSRLYRLWRPGTHASRLYSGFRSATPGIASYRQNRTPPMERDSTKKLWIFLPWSRLGSEITMAGSSPAMLVGKACLWPNTR